jgi:dGTPase
MPCQGDAHFYDHLRMVTQRLDDHLSPHGCPNAAYVRKFHKFAEDRVIRPPYARDADRILHSMAYTRYLDKTQVFFLVDNMQIAHRALHVQMVSRVARTIGRAFSLNGDLIEAIALAHDIGHPPFGHEGERILHDIAKKVGIGGFAHAVQSYRWLELIEDRDLTLQVIDGILSHNGEEDVYSLIPNREISVASIDKKYERGLLGLDSLPATYEGCLVRLSDSIAYVGRDFIDAVNVNLLNEDDLEKFPEICREMLEIDSVWEERAMIERNVVDFLVKDLLCASYNQEAIRFSDKGAEFLRAFKSFNLRLICRSPYVTVNQERMRRLFSLLYDHYLDDLEHNRKDSRIFTDFLDENFVSESYRDTVTPEQAVVDFLAGMSDGYFEARCADIILPIHVTDFSRRICSIMR